MSQSSIVEYFGEHEGYACGYCKNTNSNFTHGMWGHCLTPQDYQDLINRGWRRSGKYCYKPMMKATCCPQYTIRCDAMKFKLSRSQKKVLKRMHKFLQIGQKDSDKSSSMENDDIEPSIQHLDQCDSAYLKSKAKDLTVLRTKISVQTDVSLQELQLMEDTDAFIENLPSSDSKAQTNDSGSIDNDKVKGIDPNRPACRKAKDIRRERRLQKLMKAGLPVEEAAKTTNEQKCKEKSLEDFLDEPFTSEPAHELRLRLVPCHASDAAFSQSFQESHRMYRKYQNIIHNDPLEKCDESQFTRFLVTNPYQTSEEETDTEFKLGSYHQQYWLDNRLIAVGVLDVLPYCVSSVYLYYDPDYSFLSLGTYASLREIALTRELKRKIPNLMYYYMGFYIHSCQKMRYKAAYSPSYLLCPETYTFHAVSKCIPKLNVAKYQRFEEDSGKRDEDGMVDLRCVLILNHQQMKTYPFYQRANKEANDEELVKEYANLIGKKCYKRILLYRS